MSGVSGISADREMANSPGKLAGALIGAAIAAILFAAVVATAKPDEVWRLFQSTDGGMLAMAAAMSVAFLSARGLRLLLLVDRGLLSWPRATLVAAAAQAAALFVPVRTGELALPLLLARTTGRSFTAGVGTLFAARALDLATLGVWSGAAVLAVRGFREPLAIVVSLALFLPSLLLPLTLAVADRFAVRCFATRGMRGRRWARRVRRVRRELEGLLRRPLRLIAAVVTSVVMWGLQWAVAWILLVAMGYRWPPTTVVAGSAAASVTNLLPFNLVGNLGTLEAGWTAAFTALGVPLQVAAATGVAAHLWGLIFAALFGLAGWVLLTALSRDVPPDRDRG
ncbi:MAG: flippase-like domain-containing protein [Acidobacteria bacterium]|nr:flippase-like domain-containing protein [Candidatus Sulfomarinibacter kjeldsenii]